MTKVEKFIPLIIVGAAIIASTAAIDFSAHPFMQRLKTLENVLNNNTQHRVKEYIQAEADWNDPSNNTNLKNVGESMIQLLTFYGKFEKEFTDQMVNKYTDIMKKLLAKSDPATEFRNNAQFAEYFLDVPNLIQTLSRSIPRESEIEWLSYATVVAVQMSTNMKHSFTKGMWMNLNDMRIQGNGVYAVKQIRESHMTEYVPKLSYKTIMVDSELTNRNVTGFREMESQAKRIVVENSLDYALRMFANRDTEDVIERAVSSLYAALLELSNEELSHFTQEIAYALELHKMAPDSEVVAIFHSILEKKCEETKILNKVQLELKDIREARTIIDNDSDRNNEYIQCYPLDQITLDRLKRFGIALRLLHSTQQNLKHSIELIFYKAGDKMCNPKVLDDADELASYSRLHNQIFSVEETLFRSYCNNTDPSCVNYLNDRMQKYSHQAEELIASIEVKTPEGSFTKFKRKIFRNTRLLNVRNRIRVLLRFAINLSNAYVTAIGRVNEAIRPIVKIIATTYLKLWKHGAEIFVTAEDTTLLSEWLRFTYKFPEVLKSVLDAEMIEDLVSYGKKTNHDNPDTRALFYVFLARIASFLAWQGRLLNERSLSQKVLELEEEVGYADTSPPFIQKLVQREKQLFYIHHLQSNKKSILVFPFHLSLGDQIRHHVELATTSVYWPDGDLPFSKRGVLYEVKNELFKAILEAGLADKYPDANMGDKDGRLRDLVHKLIDRFNTDFRSLTTLAKKSDSIYGKFSECT